MSHPLAQTSPRSALSLIMSELEAEIPNAGQGGSDEISAEEDAASLYRHQFNLLKKIPR